MTEDMTNPPENSTSETTPESQSPTPPPEHTGETAQGASGDTSAENEQTPTSDTGDGTEGQDQADPADFEYDHPDDGDEDDGADDGGDGALGKARQQAAQYRQRAKQSAAEVEASDTLLRDTRQRVVDDAAQRARLDPRLLRAAGVSAEDFVDSEGFVDNDQLGETIERVRDEFGVPRGYGRNRAQDKGGGLPPKTGLADAFKR